MGTWGTSPLSSDDFGDMRLQLVRGIDLDSRLVAMRVRDDSWSKWAYVGLVLWAYHAGFSTHESVKIAKDYLAEIGGDDEYISSWRSPTAFKKAFREVSDEIDKMWLDSSPVALIAGLEAEYDHTGPAGPKRHVGQKRRRR